MGSIMKRVNAEYPNNGGAFFWAASADNGWAAPVKAALGIGPGATPTPTPSSSPTSSPPTSAPTQVTDCSGKACKDPSHCRSKWGYCGSDARYCNAESTWKANGCSNAPPTRTPTAAPTVSPTREPPISTVTCVPIGTCDGFDWCNQQKYSAWCRDAAKIGACPSPFCITPIAGAQISSRKLRVGRHHSTPSGGTVLLQHGADMVGPGGPDEIDEHNHEIVHDEF